MKTLSSCLESVFSFGYILKTIFHLFFMWHIRGTMTLLMIEKFILTSSMNQYWGYYQHLLFFSPQYTSEWWFYLFEINVNIWSEAAIHIKRTPCPVREWHINQVLVWNSFRATLVSFLGYHSGVIYFDQLILCQQFYFFFTGINTLLISHWIYFCAYNEILRVLGKYSRPLSCRRVFTCRSVQ